MQNLNTLRRQKQKILWRGQQGTVGACLSLLWISRLCGEEESSNLEVFKVPLCLEIHDHSSSE